MFSDVVEKYKEFSPLPKTDHKLSELKGFSLFQCS